MRGIINCVFGIIQRVDMQIDFDPIAFLIVLVLMLILCSIMKFNRGSADFILLDCCLNLVTVDYDYDQRVGVRRIRLETCERCRLREISRSRRSGGGMADTYV